MASESNSEWLTRKRLVDPKLKAAGWRIVPFKPNASLDSYEGCAIEEFETVNGPLDRRNPALALKALQATSPVELGLIPFVNNISCLYHVYVRGEAYLAAGQGNTAAAEFQKILDHSGIVWNCWTGALAHVGMARAKARQSRTSQGADADAARVRALAAYKDFLTLWKDADPDSPILKEAKAEYAKLQ
jgi:hypothetical protein